VEPISTSVSALQGLTDGELIELATLAGDRTLHRGMDRYVLETAVQTTLEEGPASGDGPFDPHRREIMEWLAAHEGRIKLHCHGNCFLHTDARVAQCWIRLKKGST
jgi:hypothetical protein